MIGPRGASAAIIALALALVLGLVAIGLGAGGPNPELALNANRLVLERATDADLALASAQDALTDALDIAREGAAAVVAGEAAPGPLVADASAQLLVAAGFADEAAAAVTQLEAARRANAPESEPLPAGVDGDELRSIALQLDGVVAPADTFADMRRRASNVPVALEAALNAVRDRDFDLADTHLAIARADQQAVAGWDVDFVTLPVWIATTDRSITIVEQLFAALRAGDVPAAEQAAADLASLGDDATMADRALQIAISEGGGTVAAAPLSRLVAAKRALDDLRAAVGNVGVTAGSTDR